MTDPNQDNQSKLRDITDQARVTAEQSAQRAQEVLNGIVDESAQAKARRVTANVLNEGKRVVGYLEGYGPVLVIAGGVLANAYFAKKTFGLHVKLLDVTQALNTNLLHLGTDLTEELAGADDFRVNCRMAIDFAEKSGVGFKFYPGVGVKFDNPVPTADLVDHALSVQA